MKTLSFTNKDKKILISNLYDLIKHIYKKEGIRIDFVLGKIPPYKYNEVIVFLLEKLDIFCKFVFTNKEEIKRMISLLNSPYSMMIYKFITSSCKIRDIYKNHLKNKDDIY